MALPVISSIEQIRLSQSIKASKNLNSAVGNITAHSGTTSSVHVVTQNDKDIAGWSLVAGGIKNGQIVRSPLDYIKLFLALVIHSFVSNPYIFYIAFLLVFYKIVRIMISLFF